MNAKLFLLLGATAVLNTATAQPIITSDCNPKAGDVTTQFGASLALSVGGSGANQVWDFSGITFNLSLGLNYDQCSASPKCGTFVGANLFSVDNDGKHCYYNADNNSYSIWGKVEAGLDIIYSDCEDLLRFPLNFGTTYTDKFAAAFVNGGLYTRGGEVTVTADAWGTLKLPNAVYNNVLRVHISEHFADTLLGLVALTQNTDVYVWYSPYHRTPLAISTGVGLNGAPLVYLSAYTANPPVIPTKVGEVNALANVHLYPNPATNNLTVALPATVQPSDAAIFVSDVSGRKMPVPVSYNGNAASLQTTQLPAGLYLLHLATAEGSHTMKFEKH